MTAMSRGVRRGDPGGTRQPVLNPLFRLLTAVAVGAAVRAVIEVSLFARRVRPVRAAPASSAPARAGGSDGRLIRDWYVILADGTLIRARR
jgi:hypothetical protein